jgi:hypothetical protein
MANLFDMAIRKVSPQYYSSLNSSIDYIEKYLKYVHIVCI